MYLRFVHLQVREGQEGAFTRFYQERAIPALAATEGCLFAGLLAPWRGESHQSLTIWRTAEDAADYEDRGVYRRLLGEAAPMLADTHEWRVRLSRDPEETIDPSRREPPTEGYQIGAQSGQTALDSPNVRPFVRIVVVRVIFGKMGEFVSIYRNEVMPALQRVHGCRGVFLAEGVNHPLEVLSITLWDREEDAVRYEMNGEFERLTTRLAGTFAPVYDWRTRLGEKAPGGRPGVASYQLVRGRRLGPAEQGVAPPRA